MSRDQTEPCAGEWWCGMESGRRFRLLHRLLDRAGWKVELPDGSQSWISDYQMTWCRRVKEEATNA